MPNVQVYAQYTDTDLGTMPIEEFRRQEVNTAIYSPDALHQTCEACEDIEDFDPAACPLGADECLLLKVATPPAMATHLDLSGYQVQCETGMDDCPWGDPMPVLRTERGMCEMCPAMDERADYVVQPQSIYDGDPVYYCASHMYDAIFVYGDDIHGQRWTTKQ